MCIKLLGADGQWRFSEPLSLKGRFKRVKPQAAQLDLCPSLVLRGAKVQLACPVEVRPGTLITNKEFARVSAAHPPQRVCAVDVGINTAATAAIVGSTGTVIARKFLNCGRHNDRRIEGYSLDAARRIASELAAFAAAFGAKVFVIEDLKGWRPKEPSKAQRKRFHRFQHRALVKALTYKAQELGARLLEVFARGTSRWAYDGSGKVQRSKTNAQLATFTSGKQYNADLNGALNIAARGIALLLGLKPQRNEQIEQQAATGKSSGAVARMPLVLADVWAYAQTSRAGALTGRGASVGESIAAGLVPA